MLEMNPDVLSVGHHISDMDGSGNPVPVIKASWQVPLVRTVAVTGEGIQPLVQALRDHLAFLKRSGLWQISQKTRLRRDLEALIREVLFQTWVSRMNPQEYDQALDRLFNRTISPFHLAEELIASDYAVKTPETHLK
jgi:LAO/AO transport system kinase